MLLSTTVEWGNKEEGGCQMYIVKVIRRGRINSRCQFDDGSNGLVRNPVVAGQQVDPKPIDNRSFEKELSLCRSLVYRYLRSKPKEHTPIRLPRIFSPEDIVQEVFFHLWTSGTFEQEYGIKAIGKVVWDAMINCFKSAQAVKDYSTTSLNAPASSTLEDEMLDYIQSEVETENLVLAKMSKDEKKKLLERQGKVTPSLSLTWKELFEHLYEDEIPSKTLAKTYKVSLLTVEGWKSLLLNFLGGTESLAYVKL
jgi:DNA-directed RNA polymerase specialized sigma24 family protein